VDQKLQKVLKIPRYVRNANQDVLVNIGIDLDHRGFNWEPRQEHREQRQHREHREHREHRGAHLNTVHGKR
jgi:hypothetical protein